MAEKSEEALKFDFDAHRESAVAEYAKIRPLYMEFAETAKDIISDILHGEKVKYYSIDARAKEIDEFGNKAAKQSESDPVKPKYPHPLKDITDMAGVRVITFLPRTVGDVCKLIEREFTVLENVDKAEKLVGEGKFGYQSVHYLVRMHPSRSHLAEYQSYSDLILEIQVRTILQHAWAEMEHNIQYKSTILIPTLIKRRFSALAALLDIADLEFQTLQDEYVQKKQQKERDIGTFIGSLRKAISEGDSSDREYAIEALRDLNLWLESEKSSEEPVLEDKK